VLPKVVRERIIYLKVRRHKLLEIWLRYHLSCELKVVFAKNRCNYKNEVENFED